MQITDQTLFREKAYIKGVWQDAANQQTLTVINPANGRRLGTVPNMGAAETRLAIFADADLEAAVAGVRWQFFLAYRIMRSNPRHANRARRNFWPRSAIVSF